MMDATTQTADDSPRGFAALCRRAVACFEAGALKPALVDRAQPRWVGPRYRSATPKVVLLLINPGSGKGHAPNATLRELLRGFEAGEVDLGRIMEFQKRDIPRWGRGGFASAYLDRLGLDLESVALANVAWCAERDDRYPGWMLSRCFERHTADLLRLLEPDAVVLCGAAAQAFSARVGRVLPAARLVPAPHYAARDSRAKMDADLSAVRAVLRSLGAMSGRAGAAPSAGPGPAPEREAETRRPRMLVARPAAGGAPPAAAGAARAAEIARSLGMSRHSKVASGRYLRSRTTTPNIHVIVFHRHGRDCVGVEGVRDTRERVLRRRDDWSRLGLAQHQKSDASHKSAATFIAERAPQPDGSLHPELVAVYRELVRRLGPG